MSEAAIRRRQRSPLGRRWSTGALIALALTLFAAPAISPAWAHRVPTQEPAALDQAALVAPRDDTQPRIAPAPAHPGVIAGAIAVTTLGGIALMLLARRRHPLALALAVIAVVFAFESGIHSVHHLGSPSDAARCAVAAAVTHSPGLVGEIAVRLAAPGVWSVDAAIPPGPAPLAGIHRAFQSRAPPARPPARV